MNIPDAEKIYYLLTDAKNPVSYAFISNKEMRDLAEYLAEYLVENGVRVGDSIPVRIDFSDIFDCFTREQRTLLYTCAGYALEEGLHITPTRQTKYYRELIKPLDDISKKVVDLIIDEAIREGKQ